MLGSSTSIFSEPDDYLAMLQRDGGCELVVTGHGEFRAELTRIQLPCMHLMAGSEDLSRITFVSLPAELMLIALPARNGDPLYLDGIVLRADEIVTQGPGQRMHELTYGPCRWRTIGLPAHDLLRYGRAIVGRLFDVPPGMCRWRPHRQAIRQLSRLHDDAVGMSKAQPRVLTVAEATRGLEQELIAVLIDCMRQETIDEDAAASVRRTNIMCQFEDVLSHLPDSAASIAEICSELKVPPRTLRACCQIQLGMGPRRYLHLRQLQRARRALRGAASDATRISDVARQFGFRGPSRFAASYRAQFGELPSDTIARRRKLLASQPDRATD